MTLTDKLIEVTTDEVMLMVDRVAAEKQAGYDRHSEVKLNEALCTAIEQYLNEAASDRSLYHDWEWGYMRDVIAPALRASVFSGVCYAGFGPRSITMRFQKSPKTPEFARVLRAIGDSPQRGDTPCS